MIKGTVALPVYNSPGIAWLSMESLCRQEKPSYGWELIIYEEKHLTQCGMKYFFEYKDRLEAVGCESLIYLSAHNRIPLSQKWRSIAFSSSLSSEYFCLCGCDDYKHSRYLIESEEMTADWMFATKSYFYDFSRKKVILYDSPGRWIGPQMTARTRLMLSLPDEAVNKAVDSWISNNLNFKSFSHAKSWKGNLCTNGLNNISLERGSYFDDIRPPFKETNIDLFEIVPHDIAKKLIQL